MSFDSILITRRATIAVAPLGGRDILDGEWDKIRAKSLAFEGLLPVLERPLRAQMNTEVMAAIALTRVLPDGQVVTMGYCELNQRDSFFTSWVHLVLFPEAEIRMINSSCAHQRPDGKIPTTILPLIEREGDIDGTAYFVLRIVRFVRYWRDHQLGSGWFEYARKAVGYLIGRCERGTPAAVDYWADWKDVPGMSWRRHGPHFVLLVKAAVKEFNVLARLLREPRIDFEVVDEPLWDDELGFYVDVGRDGKRTGHFHEDQIVPALWGVVPVDRLSLIIAAADKRETALGLPETVPDYGPDFGYPPGEYHNGGIWPWLAFADAAARIANGFRESGERLLRKVARADAADGNPSEFINAKTGVCGGHPVQGWNACAFLAFSLVSPTPGNDLPRLVGELVEGAV